MREVLAGIGHPVKHSQCLETISKIEGYPDWKTHSANLNKNEQIAEQFLDELLEGEAELNLEKFTRRYEEKYLVGFTESNFLRDMRNIREVYGDYLRREFMGGIAAEKRPDDDRFLNQVRYVWRGFFEKNEVLMIVGIYHKEGRHHVCEFVHE